MNDPTSSKIHVTKTVLPPLDEYTSLLAGVWERSWVTNNGPLVRELETRLAASLGVERCLYVSNGTVALQLAIRALGLTGSVITTPFSYVATTNAILWENLEPIFVDITADSYNLDPAAIAAAVRPDTTAILATHVYGYPCDDRALRAVAEQHGLRVIYDAAHAYGVELGGQSVLELGDVSTLSFHATKVFHTIEGGGVISPRAALREHLELMRSFGHTGREYHCLGLNAKTSELHAGVGLLNLPRYAQDHAARRRHSERYWAELAPLPLAPYTPADYGRDDLHYNYAYLPVRLASEAERERVVARLEAAGIYPRRYFEPSLNELPFLRADQQRPCPNSEAASRTVLCLPLYVDLTDEEQGRVIRALQSCYA